MRLEAKKWQERRSARVIALSAMALASTMALAQESPSLNYTSFEATSASPTQIGYYGTANKDCSAAQAPRIRVVEPPKAGTFTVRPGELTTTSIKGCGALKIRRACCSIRRGRA